MDVLVVAGRCPHANFLNWALDFGSPDRVSGNTRHSCLAESSLCKSTAQARSFPVLLPTCPSLPAAPATTQPVPNRGHFRMPPSGAPVSAPGHLPPAPPGLGVLGCGSDPYMRWLIKEPLQVQSLLQLSWEKGGSLPFDICLRQGSTGAEKQIKLKLALQWQGSGFQPNEFQISPLEPQRLVCLGVS